MSFPIVVEIDPSKATLNSPGARTVQNTLTGLEQRGVRAGQAISGSMLGADAGVRRIGAGAEETSRSFNRLALAARSLGAVYAAKQVIDLADGYTNLQNRLRTVTDGTAELAEVSSALFDIAQETGSSWGSTAEVFVRTTGAVKDLGLSQQETLNFTELLSKAVKNSGVTATEANAAMIQLSQGLASGTLRGDELRSVMEQLPPVADIIAEHFGVSRGELRRLGEEGKISARDIVAAFRDAGPEIEAQFAERIPTIGEEWVRLKNTAMLAIGEIANALRPLFSLLADGAELVRETLVPLAEAVGFVAGAYHEAVQEIGSFLGITDEARRSVAELSAEQKRWNESLEEGSKIGALVVEQINEEIAAQTAFNVQVIAAREALRNAETGIDGFTEATRGFSAEVIEAANNFKIFLDLANQMEQKQLDARSSEDLIDKVTGIAGGGIGIASALTVKRGLKDAAEIAREVEKAQRDAAREAKQFEESIRDLAASVFPAAAAQAELADTQANLNRAVRDGILSEELAIEVYERKAEVMREAIDPYGALLGKYQEEIDLLKLTNDEREREIEARLHIERIQAQGRELTEDEIGRIYDYVDALRIAREEAELAQKFRDQPVPLVGDVFAQAPNMGLGGLPEQASLDIDKLFKIQEAMSEWKEAWLEIRDIARDVAETASGTLASAIVDAARTGELAWEDWGRTVLANLAEAIIQALILKGIQAAFGGGSAIAPLLGATPIIDGGANATGGQYMIPGTGGTDSALFMARVTPGEHVTITPPGQPAPGGASPATNVTNQINNVVDADGFVDLMDTPRGHRVILNVIRLHPQAVKGLLR